MTDASTHNNRIVQQFTRWARPFSELAVHSEADGLRRTLAAARLDQRTQMLDVACGPGIVACAAATQAGHVTGIDLTPAMIEQARERQQRSGLTNLTWRIGDETKLPFPDQSFDVVLTRYSFHHMPEPIAALREMKRVVRPAGRIIVIDATPSPETQAAYDRMEILRDASHTSALTVAQLRALGHAIDLHEEAIDGYALDVKLQTLADPADMEALVAMFDEDIRSGENRIGVVARREEDGICFQFPISIVAWSLPEESR
ncbi:MAG TPA: class I SAM-dependent methyltransferase [Rhizomicrobium sp.]|nr:class I SAM-dependent methyltransferase [Rhizomicrobium sp.]